MLDPALRRRLSEVARGTAAEAPVEISAASQTTVPFRPAFRVEHRASDGSGELLIAEFPAVEACPEIGSLASGITALRALLDCEPERILVLDIETAGFCGVPLFLIGALRFHQGDPHILQIFARDYAEEKRLLCEFARVAAGYDAAITFNGSSFDLPFLRDRGVFHHVPIGLPERHFDVLTHARRRWRRELPDCRLQTLETSICGRRRCGDVPGSLIPGMYHEYVRTGDISPLLPVFHHNALDLVTTLEICLRLGAEAD